jgi:hypothetical protein
VRLYKTTGYDDSHGRVISWSGSRADAAKDRKAMQTEYKLAGKPATVEVDVPTRKADLLDWLNGQAADS